MSKPTLKAITVTFWLISPLKTFSQFSERLTGEIQFEVCRWMVACLGPKNAFKRDERNFRFIEEALELSQSLGIRKKDVLALVDYVFDRPKGRPEQEFGGVIVTLNGLATANNINLSNAGEFELDRNWINLEKIAEKASTAPAGPLPQSIAKTEPENTDEGT